VMGETVDQVKEEIAGMLATGLATRPSIFW
jgi:hypothetical protein